MNDIAIGDDKPDTISKYVATVTSQGKDKWVLIIDDVRYFTADPTVVYSKSRMVTVDFAGTEQEACAEVCERMKKFVEDRDAVKTNSPITITEEDLV